ncbi:MAG: 4a-hydroxytetrahydrobiopterin dehydratase [Bdellovibrionota bacterium]|nr:4a-hydroxytetrahydrobiopterin dehydratase [Bdellovibrionota bacterium]
MDLVNKKCIPCSGGVPPLPEDEILKLKKEISPEWELTHGNTRLLRKIKFKDFKTSMDLAIKIGELAEEQWHHPELLVGFGHLDIEIWTHKINGLVESDFIFAAKVDGLYSNIGEGSP